MVARRFLETYSHGGKIGVMVEIRCESIVPLGSNEFLALAHDLAMQIAAENPDNVEDLLVQRSIRNTDKTVSEVLQAVSAHFSEQLDILRFIRWTVDDPLPPPESSLPKSPAGLMRIVK